MYTYTSVDFESVEIWTDSLYIEDETQITLRRTLWCIYTSCRCLLSRIHCTGSAKNFRFTLFSSNEQFRTFWTFTWCTTGLSQVSNVSVPEFLIYHTGHLLGHLPQSISSTFSLSDKKFHRFHRSRAVLHFFPLSALTFTEILTLSSKEMSPPIWVHF